MKTEERWRQKRCFTDQMGEVIAKCLFPVTVAHWNLKQSTLVNIRSEGVAPLGVALFIYLFIYLDLRCTKTGIKTFPTPVTKIQNMTDVKRHIKSKLCTAI